MSDDQADCAADWGFKYHVCCVHSVSHTAHHGLGDGDGSQGLGEGFATGLGVQGLATGDGTLQGDGDGLATGDGVLQGDGDGLGDLHDGDGLATGDGLQSEPCLS